MDYYTLFEKLTELMTSLDGFNIPEIFSTLAQLCKTLRISKGITSFYQNLEMEKAGKGEYFVCYDSGEDHVLVSSLRLVTPAQIVVKCDVYQAKGAEPLTDDERRKVEIIQRMMLTYMNRSRQEEIIERLMYYGDDGFHNLRFFYSEIMRLKSIGLLAGKTAIRINLKHFTYVNDQYGMKTGDFVMHGYCRMLTEAFQNSGVLCRLGGDNFVAIFDTKFLPEVEKVLRGIPVPLDEKGARRVEISAVAGIFRIKDQDEVEEPGFVMGRIVNAYLIAKREYTNDIIYYSDVFQIEKEKELHIQSSFNTGLEKEEFLVYYQPKVDITTRNLIGAEALCRWNHNGTIIPPLDFIPVLERGMDICRLDFYMLDHVCRDIRKWLDAGYPVVRVSINFSRRHMMDPDLFRHIVEVIDAHEIPHKLVEIELTETTTDVEFRDLKRVVSQLQNAGIYVSVDDFGVGYSSLNLIKQIPWDVLKLDKSILPAKGEDQDRGDRMFAHIIAMAHEIGLKCVAEGVETEEQLDVMKRYGCNIAQGFLFDRPLPVADFEARLSSGSYV